MHTLPSGRWQECLADNKDDHSRRIIDLDAWFRQDCLANGTSDERATLSASNALRDAVRGWMTEAKGREGGCPRCAHVCNHKVRAGVLSVALWLAVASRNGRATLDLLEIVERVEEDRLACKSKTCTGKRDSKGDEGSRNARARVLEIVAKRTRMRDETVLSWYVEHAVHVCFGYDPCFPRAEFPSPAERVLLRLDPLALVVSDLLCERRMARSETGIESALEGEHAFSPFVASGRPDMLDAERVLSATDMLLHLSGGAGAAHQERTLLR